MSEQPTNSKSIIRRHSSDNIRGEPRLTTSAGMTTGRAGIIRPLPMAVWVISGGLAVWGLFTSNPLLTIAGVLLLPILASLLWFPGEPPVLLFACGLQWLQASTGIFYANHLTLPIDIAFETQNFERATWLSLTGILVLACGMRLGLGRAAASGGWQMITEANHISPTRLFGVFLGAFLGCRVIRALAFLVPGLTQPLIAMATLEWVIVFLFAYVVTTRRQGYGLLAIALLIEFSAGILGFFAEFKRVFFVVLVVVMSSPRTLSNRRIAASVFVALLLLIFGVIWTAVKAEYRDFLNQGSGQQEVVVPISDRMGKLGELVTSVDSEKVDEGVEDMILRISYVSYFAQTISNVPENMPYENGALWMGAIKHVFLPRLFFPNKPIIKDSERTQYYTGQRVSGTAEGEGTSITIGYLGESYIDFGPVGMFAPVFILGAFWGISYRYLINRSPSRLLGYSMAGPLIMFLAGEFMSNAKILGSAAVTLIVYSLFLRFGAKQLLSAVCERPGRRTLY